MGLSTLPPNLFESPPEQGQLSQILVSAGRFFRTNYVAQRRYGHLKTGANADTRCFATKISIATGAGRRESYVKVAMDCCQRPGRRRAEHVGIKRKRHAGGVTGTAKARAQFPKCIGQPSQVGAIARGGDVDVRSHKRGTGDPGCRGAYEHVFDSVTLQRAQNPKRIRLGHDEA